jgi:cell division protein FtsB
MSVTGSAHIVRRTVRQLRLGVVTAWLLAVAVLALIGTVYLAQASQAASEGAALETLKQRLAEVQRNNTQLAAAVAAAQSPDRLARRAAELGYRPATADEIEYLPVPGYPTPRPQAPPAPAEPAATISFANWWARLLGWTGLTGGGP